MNKNNEVLLRIAKILTRMERDMYGKGEGPINVLFLIDEDEKDKRLNAIDAAYGLVKAFDISINIDFPHQTDLEIWFGMINEIRHYSMMIFASSNFTVEEFAKQKGEEFKIPAFYLNTSAA